MFQSHLIARQANLEECGRGCAPDCNFPNFPSSEHFQHTLTEHVARYIDAPSLLTSHCSHHTGPRLRCTPNQCTQSKAHSVVSDPFRNACNRSSSQSPSATPRRFGTWAAKSEIVVVTAATQCEIEPWLRNHPERLNLMARPAFMGSPLLYYITHDINMEGGDGQSQMQPNAKKESDGEDAGC
jgi:hypothetical protein